MKNLDEVLSYILSLTTEEKMKIASKSYYHSNHFYKVVLKEFNDGSKVRIHYWNKLDNFIQNPHDHGWSFTSHILRGSLQDTILTEVDGEDFEKYILDLSIVDNKYYSKFNKRVNMIPSLKRRFKQGDVYTSDTATVHTSYPEEEGTITLLFQSPQTRFDNFIYKPSNGDFETVKHHRFLTIEELDFVLEETVKSLVENLRLKGEKTHAR